MHDLGDEFLSLTVTATSPDGQISARFGEQGKAVELAFRPGAYRRYSDTSLAHELARLAMRVMARYVRAQQKLIDDAVPDVLHDDGIEYGYEDREYRRHMTTIKAAAESPDGRIAVVSHSLARWDVRIADGTVRGMTEEAFKAGLLRAVQDVLAQHQREVLELAGEHYGAGISDTARRRMGLPERRGSR